MRVHAKKTRSATPRPRNSAAKRVYVIVALFVGIIFGFVSLIELQMDALTAIRTFVGGEGLWAKAQKDAVRSLEHYAVTRNESDFQAFQRSIQVPLGDRQARLELQSAKPDLERVRAGLLQGGVHPDDVDPAIRFFQRFEHTAQMQKVIAHWTEGDRLIQDIIRLGDRLRAHVRAGESSSVLLRDIDTQLNDIYERVSIEEIQFSATLSDASRWANQLSTTLLYPLAVLLGLLGAGLSWPIIKRIHQAEADLAKSESRLRSLYDNVSDIIYTIGSDGCFVTISPSIERMLGWQAHDWIGRSFEGIVHPDDVPRMQELFGKALQGERLPTFQVRIRTKTGSHLFAECVANPIEHHGEFTILGVVRDVTERKRRDDEVQALASTDGLTGLFNRRAFTGLVSGEIDRARRYKTSLSLVMFDLDFFKRINDDHGHDMGDQVLQAAAELVRSNIRSTDVCARWGGEEFMVLMPQASLGEACAVAEKLRSTMEGLSFPHGAPLTASFGAAELGAEDSFSALCKRVDQALYRAKQAGRNCVRT